MGGPEEKRCNGGLTLREDLRERFSVICWTAVKANAFPKVYSFGTSLARPYLKAPY